jgi:hypothetical protein
MRTGLAVLGGAVAIALVVVVVIRSRGHRDEARAGSASAPVAGPGAPTGTDRATGSTRPPPGLGAPTAGTAGASSDGDGAEDVARRHELHGMYGPGTMRAIPARYELVTKDGYAAVNLAGGAPTHYRAGLGSRSPPRTREIRGRVVDASNRPVAGAIVLANESIEVFGGQLLADAGATTGADGTFAIEKAPGDAVVQAFDPTGWSDVVATTGAPVELVLRGRGELRGKLSYDGHAESFALVLTRTGQPGFRVFYQSDPDGRYVIASLPVGTYAVSIGLAQSIQGGASKTVKREVTIEAGTTTTLDLDQRSSTVVVATTRLPAAVDLETIEYTLLPGKPPADRKEARTRMRAGEGTGQLVGGIDAKIALQFHDIEPGAYHVCSAVNDDLLWGCASVVVVDGDVAREVEIHVAAPP